MTALNAKERTKQDWEGLFRLADGRLQIAAGREQDEYERSFPMESMLFSYSILMRC